MFIVLCIDQCSARVGRAEMNLRSFSRVAFPPSDPRWSVSWWASYKHGTPNGVKRIGIECFQLRRVFG